MNYFLYNSEKKVDNMRIEKVMSIRYIGRWEHMLTKKEDDYGRIFLRSFT